MHESIGEYADRESPARARSATAVLAERMAASIGTHDPGWRLPRASALARRFDVTPGEIEGAIRELTERNFLRRLPDGHVYRASPAEYLIGLEGLPGVGAYIDPMGAPVSRGSRTTSWRRVPEDIGLLLNLPPGAHASVIRCRWTVNGHNAALSTTYLAGCPDTAGEPGQPGSASIDAALNRTSIDADAPGSGPYPMAAHVEVQAPPQWAARALGLAPGAPAFTVAVRFSDAAGILPATLTAAILRCDLFRIVLDAPTASHSPQAYRLAAAITHA